MIAPESSMHGIPSLYTIVNCCSTVLFSLETNTNYGESDPVSSVSEFEDVYIISRHHFLRYQCNQGHSSAMHVHRSDERSVPALSRRKMFRELDRGEYFMEEAGKHRFVGGCGASDD